jgi:hypothetical protein
MNELDLSKVPKAVETEFQAAYLDCFPEGDPRFVPRAFGWVTPCFTGDYQDYQAVDAHYHDFEHTLQGTLCLGRLLRGWHLAGAEPPLTERIFQLGLLAILMHDTGYLKRRGDTEGTGAKYTVTHVQRSADFAGDLLGGYGFSAEDVKSVQNMIHCTGVELDLKRIPFQSDLEKLTGFAVGTADLLGQMAAADYVEKLPVLYAEFAEALRFSKSQTHFISHFVSAHQLMEETPRFWENMVRKKLDQDFQGVWRFLNNPYPSGRNLYFDRIEANMARLKRELAPA